MSRGHRGRWSCSTRLSAPFEFEITPATRDAVQKWIKQAGLGSDDFLFPSRIHDSPHLGTRQYARILEGWAEELGIDPAEYGTHSMRRTKATLIYRRNQEPPCRSVAARAFEAGVDCAVSRHRSRRRPGNLRTDGNLTRQHQPPARRCKEVQQGGRQRHPGDRSHACPSMGSPGHNASVMCRR